jgi:hypothetical protein
MNAKEILENLGYKFKENELFIYYDINAERYFIFDKRKKEISIGSYDISVDELKAIHKQAEELGWLDE